MQKYGVDNPFKSDIIKQKIANQIYNKFGVYCYLQTDAARVARKKAQRYIDIGTAQAKRRFTCLVRYGVDHEWKDKKHRLKLYEKMKFTNISKQELFIRKNMLNWTQLLNYTCIFNNKSIIYPYELDIYIPDINLAIEYNGTYWHSIKLGKSINYHLNKSLLCRQLNIRLIHIYEFEDIDMQIELLKQLILYNNDIYNSNDFNKNNLITNVPKPEIIYTDGKNTIYGAGKLYNMFILQY